MSGETVRVVARITGRPDSVEQLKSLLVGLIAATKMENGCLGYQLFQNKADPTDFTFIEEWTSDESIDVHLATPHVQDALAKGGALFGKEPDIRRYSLIG